MKNNIALIGMMGSGKTTVAEELHKILPQYSLIDIDKEIEKNSGKKISEIFLKYGEPHFRALENEKIQRYTSNNNQIIALGGGAFENTENRKNILENCTVIYLDTSAKEIYERIKSEFHRPLLHKNFSLERIEDIIKKRKKNYETAHITINTDGKTADVVAMEIIGALNGKS